jgi:hypothetical protein
MWSTRPFSMPFEFYIGHMRSKHLLLVAIALIGAVWAGNILEAQKLTLGDVVVLPAARRGALIEIDLIAVRPIP